VKNFSGEFLHQGGSWTKSGIKARGIEKKALSGIKAPYPPSRAMSHGRVNLFDSGRRRAKRVESSREGPLYQRAIPPIAGGETPVSGGQTRRRRLTKRPEKSYGGDKGVKCDRQHDGHRNEIGETKTPKNRGKRRFLILWGRPAR